MVEGANSKRVLANRTPSCGCCGRGYGSQSRRCSLRGCPSADTYDNICSLSHSQPYSHRHAYTYAYSCAHAHADPHADPHGHPYADADADPDPNADSLAHPHPYARLPRTIPKLGMAILR